MSLLVSKPNLVSTYTIISLSLRLSLAITLPPDFYFFIFTPKLLGNMSDFHLYPVSGWLLSSGGEMNESFCIRIL